MKSGVPQEVYDETKRTILANLSETFVQSTENKL
jgi:hypothetical protein